MPMDSVRLRAIRTPRNEEEGGSSGGTLRERQKRKRRFQMLDAAEALFNEKGFDATTIGEIAQLAEVSPATIHNYYQGKGEMLLALVERTDDSIVVEIRKMALGRPEDPLATINRILEMITVQSLHDLEYHVWRHAIATSITREDPEFGVGFSYAHHKFIKAISLVLTSMKEQGLLLDSIEPEILASVLYKVQHTLFIELIVEPKLDMKRYRLMQRKHVNLIMKGLMHAGD